MREIYRHVKLLKVVTSEEVGGYDFTMPPPKKKWTTNVIFIFFCVLWHFSKRKSQNRSKDHLIEPRNKSD